MEYTPRFLLKVEPGANNNKYYNMTPNENDFQVEYGRVGSSAQKRTYPLSQWDSKYREKISKGYIDQTDMMKDLISATPVAKEEYAPITDKAIAEIVNRLRAMANQAIRENYSISSSRVTQAMVDAAGEAIRELTLLTSVEDFNALLVRLFSIIPRKMTNVSTHLAQSQSDFGRIVQAESDLLDVMRGQIYCPPPPSEEPVAVGSQTILEANGLIIEPANSVDIIRIKRLLRSCAGQFHQAWRVRNDRTQSAFDTFVRDQGHIPTKLFWHGSRNENWWSIINMGLVLKPTSAVITGKMFGYGTYFAPKAKKSLGYTSLSGSYWAGGNSDTAFMAVYDVAYGKPYDVHSFEPRLSSFNYEKLQAACPGAHSLHAHEGEMLRNDEVVVYREDQTTIKYLVELKN